MILTMDHHPTILSGTMDAPDLSGIFGQLISMNPSLRRRGARQGAARQQARRHDDDEAVQAPVDAAEVVQAPDDDEPPEADEPIPIDVEQLQSAVQVVRGSISYGNGWREDARHFVYALS